MSEPEEYEWEDHPLRTDDCAWCCCVDLLKAQKTPVGTITKQYFDIGRGATATVEATVFYVQDSSFLGDELTGHVAIADYRDGKLVWTASDLSVTDAPNGER